MVDVAVGRDIHVDVVGIAERGIVVCSCLTVHVQRKAAGSHSDLGDGADPHKTASLKVKRGLVRTALRTPNKGRRQEDTQLAPVKRFHGWWTARGKHGTCFPGWFSECLPDRV